MAMTAGERKKIVQQLGGDWYRLDRVISDDAERQQFIWDVAKDGLVEDRYFCNELGNHFDASHTPVAVEFLSRVSKKVDDYTNHRGTKGWDYCFEWLMTRIAEQDPKGLLAAQDKLPPMFQDFSVLFLAHEGALSGELPETAKRRLAVAWAATTWDEQWYDVRESIPDEEWADLVLESICAPEVTTIEWDRIRVFAERATPAQAAAIVSKDNSQHVRAHAAALLANLDPSDFATVEEGIASIETENNYYGEQQRAALALALVAAYGRAGKDVPAKLQQYIVADLGQWQTQDIETTVAALQALKPEQREELLLEALKGDGGGRVIAASAAQPTLPVLEAVLAKIEANGNENDDAVTALAAFGEQAIEPLLARVAAKGVPAPVAVTFIRAIDQIGAPAAAEALVELAGASTKGIRVAATTALENLGAAAIDAVRAGTQAKKKAIRDACSALLAQLEMAGSNPLGDLEKKARKVLDDPDVASVMDELRTSNTSSSNDYEKLTKYADKHGLSVAFVARDYFLENPGDWRHSYVWQGVVEHFEDDPNMPWLAVDAFAKLPAKMYSYYAEQQHSRLERVADKHPEEIGKAIVFYLKGSPPEYRAELLATLLRVAPRTDVDVYLAAMQDSSKVVRERGIEGIAQFGESQLPTLVAMLAEKKKDVRLAAAEALTKIPSASVRKDIEAALKAEKTADVRTMLEQAVAAAGGSAFDFPGDDGKKVTDADIDAFLAALNKPKLPGFVNLGALSLKFTSAKKLSSDALHGFLGRLMKEDADNRDELARRVRPFLDDESANALSVALKDAWANTGGASKEKWAIFQQAILASETRLDEVAPQLDEMAAWSNHHLAKWYIEVLYRHGSRGAHSWLAYWAKNAERASVYETAQACLEKAAEAAGKDVEVYATSLNNYIADDVADRQVPRLGLDQKRVVDYGPRTFDVFMDQNHNVVIRDQESLKVETSLPKPRKDERLRDDDKTEVAELKKQLKSVVKDVSKRLEAGMVSGRPWTVDAFLKLFGGHPIMGPFAGRLVFRADDGTLFRLSEGELLNADYDVVELANEQTVRIAHPLQMTADELDVWGEHFADAEIMQPFEQLGRATFGKDREMPLGKTTRGAVAGRLRRLGWRKGYAEDAGLVYTASRLLAGRGVRAWLEHGGYYVGDPSWEADEEIDVSSVWFVDLEGKEMKVEDVDPLAYSEVVLEVTQLLP